MDSGVCDALGAGDIGSARFFVGLKLKQMYLFSVATVLTARYFVTGKRLYDVVQKHSSKCKETLWIASPFAGSNAHQILSQNVVDQPPRKVRFLFGLSEEAVRRHVVSPYEIEYLQNHFGVDSVRANNTFHAKIYIFDRVALVSSANFSKKAFERNIEVGAVLEGDDVGGIKRLYAKLWKDSRKIRDLSSLKNIWNRSRRSGKEDESSGFFGRQARVHTRVKPWNEKVANWIVPITDVMTKQTSMKIQKETHWGDRVIGDLKAKTFRGMRLGDFVFLVDNVVPRRESISVVRVRDKREVAVGRQRYHFAYDKVKHTKEVKVAKIIASLKELDLATKKDRVEVEKELSHSQAEKLMKLLSR
jgi:HKD family nuclease